LISELLEKHESVSLCGLSMGATLALAVAEGRNDVLSVITLSPILRYDGWAIKWYQSLLIIPYLLGIKNWSYKESEPFGIRNIELRRRVMRAMEKDGVSQVGAAQIPARHLFAAQKMMRFVSKRLENVTADLLTIHAIDDETAAPRNSEFIIDSVSSEVRKAIWLGDCYHIITVDNEREIVANETIRFLQRSTSSHQNDLDYQRTFKRSALKDRR
jgi:carboxylesterase